MKIVPTAACVTRTLMHAGLPPAEMDGHEYRALSDGFNASDLPVEPPRVAVYWEAPPGAPGRLDECQAALTSAGFKTEVIAGHPSDYMVAWTG
jgi:hypothetical protein